LLVLIGVIIVILFSALVPPIVNYARQKHTNCAISNYIDELYTCCEYQNCICGVCNNLTNCFDDLKNEPCCGPIICCEQSCSYYNRMYECQCDSESISVCDNICTICHNINFTLNYNNFASNIAINCKYNDNNCIK